MWSGFLTCLFKRVQEFIGSFILNFILCLYMFTICSVLVYGLKSIYPDSNQVSSNSPNRGLEACCHVPTSNFLYILLSDLAQICSLSYQTGIKSTKIWQFNKPKRPAAIFRRASLSVFRCDKKQSPYAGRMETRDWWHHSALPGGLRKTLLGLVSLFLSLSLIPPSPSSLFFPVCSSPSLCHPIRRASLCSRYSH